MELVDDLVELEEIAEEAEGDEEGETPIRNSQKNIKRLIVMDESRNLKGLKFFFFVIV